MILTCYVRGLVLHSSLFCRYCFRFNQVQHKQPGICLHQMGEIVDQEWSCALRNPNPSVWWTASVATVFGWVLGRVICLKLLRFKNLFKIKCYSTKWKTTCCFVESTGCFTLRSFWERLKIVLVGWLAVKPKQSIVSRKQQIVSMKILYRPVSGRWQSQSQSQRLESKSTRRRLGEEASPRQGVAQPGRRQEQISLSQGSHSAVPRYPWVGKTTEGAALWEGLRSRWFGAVIKRRRRWLQGHSDSTRVGLPDSWSTPAASKTPLGQIRLKGRVTPRVARCRVREEGRYALKVSD